jgi:hypothetical protein
MKSLAMKSTHDTLEALVMCQPLQPFKETSMQITIELKWNYGSCAFYPVCETSKQFALIAGKKTLTQDTLRIIKSMGYTIVQISKEVAL